MIDYCQQLKEDLIKVTNENPLDLMIKYYVLKDFMRDVEISLQDYKMGLQQQEYIQQQKEKDEIKNNSDKKFEQKETVGKAKISMDIKKEDLEKILQSKDGTTFTEEELKEEEK